MYVVMENKRKVAAIEYLPFSFTWLHFSFKTITGKSPEKFHASYGIIRYITEDGGHLGCSAV
jgi:hypothetical protein